MLKLIWIQNLKNLICLQLILIHIKTYNHISDLILYKYKTGLTVDENWKPLPLACEPISSNSGNMKDSYMKCVATSSLVLFLMTRKRVQIR